MRAGWLRDARAGIFPGIGTQNMGAVSHAPFFCTAPKHGKCSMTALRPSTRMRRGTITCPVCNGPLIIDWSREVTGTTKEIYTVCGNADCASAYKYMISLVYMLSPSGLPHEHLQLPQAPAGYQRRRYRRPDEAEDDPDQLLMFGHDPPDDQQPHHPASLAA